MRINGSAKLDAAAPGACIAGVALCVLLLPVVAWAQRGRPRTAPRLRPYPLVRQRQGPRLGDQHQHLPGFFKRLRELPPEEQERVMDNDARFQRLPSDRQAQIRKNLQHWNSLTPQQKEQARQRQAILESLPPEKRQQARELFPIYNHLPPDRKQAVTQAFRRLRDLPPDQRERFLSSPQVESRFSPAERDLLKGLSGLLP